MSTVTPPFPSGSQRTPSRSTDAAARGRCDGDGDDPFGASLRSALDVREPQHPPTPRDHDRVDRGDRGRHGPEHDDEGSEATTGRRPEGPPSTDVVESGKRAAPGDTSGSGTQEPTEGRTDTASSAATPPLAGAQPAPPPEPATPDTPPGLDPRHAPPPDAATPVTPPGLDTRHAPPPSASAPAQPTASGGTTLSSRPDQPVPPAPPSALVPVGLTAEARAATGGAHPGAASGAEPATTSEPAILAEVPGVASTTDGASGPEPGAGSDAESASPLPAEPVPRSADGPVEAGTPPANPPSARPTTAPGVHLRAAPLPGTDDAEQLIRLSELAEGARAAMRRTGPASVRIQLHPAELGAVEVEVRLRDDGLHMVLRAEQPLGAERLAAELADLRRGLQRDGVQLRGLEVSVGPGDRGPDHRDDRAGGRRLDDDPTPHHAAAPTAARPPTGPTRSPAVAHTDRRLTMEL